MDLRLDGRTAVVCGSSQGIGRAVAEGLAHQGARVILLARDRGALEAVAASLPVSQGGMHEAIVADFSDASSLRSALESDLFDEATILVANFGGPPGGMLSEADPEALSSAFSMHVLTSQILLMRLLPGMKAAGFGRIVNVISTSVKQPIKGLGVSNTVRGAVASWSKTLATELGPYGITVNNVLPGPTDTARLRSLISAKAKKTGRSEDEVREEIRLEVPLGRIADASEVANAVVFLSSPAASYINGVNLAVDGGRTQSL